MRKDQKEKINDVTRTVLEILGVITLFSVAIVAPNVVMLLDKFGRKKREFDREQFNRNLYYLKNRGYAHIRNENDQIVVEITKKGKKRFLSYKIRDLKIKKPKQWDGKWRIVIADVPETKRAARDVLRSTLKKIGFYQLQKSVWVHPFECENEIKYLKESFELHLYLYFIVTEKIDEDIKIKKFYNL